MVVSIKRGVIGRVSIEVVVVLVEMRGIGIFRGML